MLRAGVAWTSTKSRAGERRCSASQFGTRPGRRIVEEPGEEKAEER